MEKIKALIEISDNILILAHKNPDGDAIGSALAFYNALLNKHKKVDIIMENIPKIFDFLPNIDKVKTTSNDEEYDLVIVLDCSNYERIGQDKHYFENASASLNIDHHVKNDSYANYNYISTNSPACSEYLIEIFDYLNIEITKEIAECLITGILTDTGGFQYSNVSEITYNFASRIAKFVDIPKIYKKVLSTKTKPQFKLTNIAMSRLELLNNDKIAFTYLLENDFNQVEALPGDHEGIVEIGRSIEGVSVSIFVREVDNVFRVSLRSNGNVNVNDIATIYGGGGHIESAGFDTTLDFNSLKESLLKEVNKSL